MDDGQKFALEVMAIALTNPRYFHVKSRLRKCGGYSPLQIQKAVQNSLDAVYEILDKVDTLPTDLRQAALDLAVAHHRGKLPDWVDNPPIA